MMRDFNKKKPTIIADITKRPNRKLEGGGGMPNWDTLVKWFPVIGLLLNIIGSIIISCGAVISKEEAVELGSPWLEDEDNEEANYENPPVIALIKQSRNTKIGFVFLTIGFIFQLISSWPK